MSGPKVVPLNIRMLVLNPYQTEAMYGIDQAIADESGIPVTPGSYVLAAVVRGVPPLEVLLTLK